MHWWILFSYSANGSPSILLEVPDVPKYRTSVFSVTVTVSWLRRHHETSAYLLWRSELDTGAARGWKALWPQPSLLTAASAGTSLEERTNTVGTSGLSVWNMVNCGSQHPSDLSWSRSRRPGGEFRSCCAPGSSEVSGTSPPPPEDSLAAQTSQIISHFLIIDQSAPRPSERTGKYEPTLASLSGISSSFGPPISSSSSSFFFFWFFSCFSFSAFFFSSSNWAFFWALRCLLRSFFNSLSVRFSVESKTLNVIFTFF